MESGTDSFLLAGGPRWLWSSCSPGVVPGDTEAIDCVFGGSSKLVVAEYQFPNDLLPSVPPLVFLKSLLLIVMPKFREKAISVSAAPTLKKRHGKQELASNSSLKNFLPCLEVIRGPTEKMLYVVMV